MSRDISDVTFEATYWRGVLEDTAELSALILAAAEQLAPGHLALVSLAWSVSTDRDRAALEQLGTVLSAAMENLGKLQAPVARIVSLAGGRVEVLSRDAGIDTEESGE
jgi:hypothetical protein